MPSDSRIQCVSAENEVLTNIQTQPVGDPPLHTVADYHHPEPFLRAVADRIIRASFVQHRRRITADAPSAADETSPRPEPALPAPDIPEGRAPLRGYRPWGPYTPPDRHAAPDLHAAAVTVAQRLSADGVLGTLVSVIQTLGGRSLLADPSILAAIGFPDDLLRYFVLPSGERSADLLPALIPLAERDPAAAFAAARAARFDFRPTISGFAAFATGESRKLLHLRLQLSSGRLWGGIGAGSGPDVLRQLLQALPQARFTVTVEQPHAAELQELVAAWGGRDRQIDILPSRYRLSQWAQDNGISGHTEGSSCVLLPRLANRGEEASIIVPGDTHIEAALEQAGISAARSPLLFQGGNLMVVNIPGSGTGTAERLALIGEAEVYRNTTLGLTAEQATEALGQELGADRTVVLPALSFHVDFDLLPWEHKGRLLAFVNDPLAAAAHILRCGIPALQQAGLLDERRGRQISSDLAAGRLGSAAPSLGDILYSYSLDRQFPESFARNFAAGPSDSGPANLLRFAHALDLAYALVFAQRISSESKAQDPDFAIYSRTLQRSAAMRRDFHRLLTRSGFRLIPVPSISEAELSLNYLNGLRDGGRYLMPASGGLYEPLDAAAAAVFARETGAEVVPIRCGETQRRSGGLHCAVATLATGTCEQT